MTAGTGSSERADGLVTFPLSAALLEMLRLGVPSTQGLIVRPPKYPVWEATVTTSDVGHVQQKTLYRRR